MVEHQTVTLTASAATLAALVATADATSKFGGTAPKAIRQLAVQPDPANSNPVYLGGTKGTLSAAAYGIRLEAPVTSIPPAPYILETAWETPITLADVKVFGTLGEKLHLFLTGQ